MYIIKSKPSNHAPSHPKGREPRLLMRSRDPKHRPAPLAVADNLLLVFLFIQGGNEFLSLQPCLLHDRDQRTLSQLRVIGHCHNQISLLIPEMDVAAGLAIDLEAQMLQSLDGLLSRDYRKLGQIARPLCREMRAFALWVPVPEEPDNALQGLSSD